MTSRQNSPMNLWKNDLWLILAVLLISAVWMLAFRNGNRIRGSYAVVSVDGSEYTRILLNHDNTITVSTNRGTNTLCVSDGKVFISEADCPDKICVGHPPIQYRGESIVCLPHRLVVTIDHATEEGPDAVSQ